MPFSVPFFYGRGHDEGEQYLGRKVPQRGRGNSFAPVRRWRRQPTWSAFLKTGFLALLKPLFREQADRPDPKGVADGEVA